MSCEHNEKKLEKLSFWCGSYFKTGELITLKNRRGSLLLDCYLFPKINETGTIPHFNAEWTRARSDRWLTRIKETHFELWKDKYWADVCDGEQWRLCFKYEGENEKVVTGSNAYPENWPQFIELMTTIARKLPRVENAEIKDAIGLL